MIHHYEFAQFVADHSCGLPPVAVGDDGTLLLADGAGFKRLFNGRLVPFDPPDDLVPRLTNKILFRRARADKLARIFDLLKNRVQIAGTIPDGFKQYGNLPAAWPELELGPPPRGWREMEAGGIDVEIAAEVLADLRQRVLAERAEIERLDAQLGAIPEVAEERERQQREAEQRERQQREADEQLAAEQQRALARRAAALAAVEEMELQEAQS